jgi:hypothetical protein
MNEESLEKYPAHWVKAIEFAKDLPTILNQAIETEHLVDFARFLIADDTRRAELDTKRPNKLYSIQSEV